MLSGQRLFGGDTVVHTLADVLRRSIEFDKLDVPAPIKTLLRRCLDRDAKTRLRDIGEARVAIAKYLVDPASGTEVPRRPRPVYRWVAWAAAAVLAMIAVVGWLRPRPAATGATAADLALTIAPTAGSLAPVGDLHATPEISPDGSAVIFYRDIASAGSGEGVQVRRLNALTPEPVRTGGFRNPGFWSPDSRSFVFSDGTNLKKMRVPDGAPEIIANDVATMVGGSWSDNGTLLVAGAVAGGPGLFVVPAAGGVAKRVEVSLPKDGFFLYWPEFLPGSEDFLVMAAASKIEESEIYLATLRDGRAADPVLLMKNATAVRYTPAGGGRILFVRNDNLYAQTLNRTTRTLEGGPELIQQRVASSPSFYAAHFSVSRTGVVAWRPGTAGLSQVTIFDREGKEIGTAGPPTVVQTLRLAPDETRLLVGFNATAWLLEPGRPGRQQLEQGDSGHAVVAGWVQAHRRPSPETIAALWNALSPGKGQFASWRNRPECGFCETFLRTARRCCLIGGHWIRRCSRFRWTAYRKNRNLCFRRARRFHMPAFRQTGAGLCTRPPRRGVNAEGSTPAEGPTCSRTRDRDYGSR